MAVCCNFCGKMRDEVAALVKGADTAAICDECVELCVDIIQEAVGPGVLAERMTAWREARKRCAPEPAQVGTHPKGGDALAAPLSDAVPPTGGVRP